MNKWYGRDRPSNDRPQSDRYDREEFYRNENPDHLHTRSEDDTWRFAGKFEDKNDPTYSYGTRERDMMREYPTYPTLSSRTGSLHPNDRPSDRDYNRSQYGSTNQFASRMNDYTSDLERHRTRGYTPTMHGGDEAYSPVSSDNTFTGRGPKGWKRSDESIKEQVCHELEMHPEIDATEIEVEVKEGIVTLKGNIHDRPAKRLAEDSIEFLPGVKDVSNQLTVDKTFFERAKEFLTGQNDVSITKRNPRH